LTNSEVKGPKKLLGTRVKEVPVSKIEKICPALVCLEEAHAKELDYPWTPKEIP